MRKALGTIACVMACAAVLLAGTPAAHADDTSFVNDAHALGFVTIGVNLVSMGQSACYFLIRNRDPGQIAERIGRYGNVDRDVANRFLVMSVAEYCPQFTDRVTP